MKTAQYSAALILIALGCRTPNVGCTPAQGCSSWEEGSTAFVWIDDPEGKFSQEDLEAIDQALSQWETATDEFIVFEFVDRPTDSQLITIRPDTRANIREDRGVSAVTDFSPLQVGGTITAPYDQGPEFLHKILVHELGHALGLEHSPDGTGVMGNPQEDSSISCQDVQAFCQSNQCEADNMPPCLKDS